MNYYRNGNSVLSTIGTLDFPVITREEYEATKAVAIERAAAALDAPEPTPEERIAALEVTTDDIILMMADLIGGE